MCPQSHDLVLRVPMMVYRRWYMNTVTKQQRRRINRYRRLLKQAEFNESCWPGGERRDKVDALRAKLAAAERLAEDS